MPSMSFERDRQHALNSPSVTTARTATEMGTASTGTSARPSPFKRAEFGSPIRMAVSALVIAAGIATASPVLAGTERESQNKAAISDAALAASVPGDFRNGYAEVNGTRIHYVEGGKGTPVLLLPGWPETWWEFHKIMPELGKRCGGSTLFPAPVP
jgi:hypothetical protein